MNVDLINLVTVDHLSLRDSLIPNYYLNPTLCVGPISPQDVAGRQSITSAKDRTKAFEYTSSVFERVFPDVCIELNRLHGVTRSDRYWRVICGLWMSYFIDICFARYSSISQVPLDPVLTRTKVVTQKANELCSVGCTGFIDLYQSDHWNHYIYGLIIEHFKIAQFEIIADDTTFEVPLQQTQDDKPHSSKEKMRRLMNRFVGRSKYALVTTYLPRKYEWMINLKHAQVPLNWPAIHHMSKPFSIAQRQKLQFKLSSADEFENFIRAVLHLQMPKTIIEEYNELLLAVQDAPLPCSPSIIFTSNQHASSDSFTIWSALQIERGTRLLIGQHGGLYGEGLVPTRHEWHEIAVSDRFITWGWDDPLHPNVFPGFSFPNAGVRQRLKEVQRNLLLLVTDSLFPYGRLSWSTLEINSIYMNFVANFLASIDSEIKHHLLLRMHHDSNRFPHQDHTTWLSKIDAAQVDDGLSSIQSLYKKSRVVVCTTLGSTYRETFARNIPTLLVVDEDVYPLRQTSKDYYRELADCRILHTSPESAGHFLSEIFADPTKWWNTDSVQSARQNFLKQHARIPANPIAEVDLMLKFDRSADPL